jgi:hypothetical protein
MRIFASMHIGKAAGTAFAHLLIDSVSHQFPVFFYYGARNPLTGIWKAGTQLKVDATASQGQLAEKFIQHVGENQAGIIQAHWTVDNFFQAFGERPLEFITWLRDPIQRICSHYFFWKDSVQPPSRPHVQELFWAVKSGRCSLQEFGSRPEICELYRTYLDPLGLEGVAFAGVVEQQTTSLQHLSRLFGVALPDRLPKKNITKQKQGSIYVISKDVKEAISAHNQSDVAIYAQAVARLTPPRQFSTVPGKK